MMSQDAEQGRIKNMLTDLREKLFTTERNRDELASQLKSLQSAKKRVEAKCVHHCYHCSVLIV